MTSNSGPRKKRKQAYDYLNRQGTVKIRREFIEADYINGVFDSTGKEVIRPMTKEEIEWLSQFYAETEHGNFKKTAEIRDQENLYKSLCRELRTKKEQLTSGEVLEKKQGIEEAYKKLVHLRSETNTFYPDDEQRHEIFDRGNLRRDDVFTIAKVSNKLISYDLPEYDKFTSHAEKDVNPENLVLDYLNRKPPTKKTTKRKKKLV